MGPVSSQIEAVRAFAVPCGVRADGEPVATPGTALVRWSVADGQGGGMYYQVYVNGRFAGVTCDSEQRQMLVQVPSSFDSAVRIEVFAVGPEDADRDFSDQIGSPPIGSGRVVIRLLRSQKLPAGATVNVYYNAGSGEIDYDKPLNDSPIRLWPCWQDKAGLGMSGFGRGDFGYDSAAAVGLGRGSFGHGQFGLDADVVEWTGPVSAMGVYRFGVKVFDEAGNQSSASETGEVTVIPAARPAEKLSVSSFNKQTNELVLSVG